MELSGKLVNFVRNTEIDMANTPVRYPIGVQSFEKLREFSYLYIDKTELLYNLVKTSNCVFLSRPRRFGKSLLLSTLKAYFEGKKELFEGLAIEQLETEWQPHAVLTLSLASYNPTIDDDLNAILDNQFQIWEQEYDVKIESDSLSARFGNIIRTASISSGRPVVILVDEYDHPLISSMHDEEKLEKNRQLLKSIYVNFKDLDGYIRFTMLTGVSRFSKMTVFSGLNNLRDISLNQQYAAICGITEKELMEDFRQGIEMLAQNNDTDYDGAVKLLKDNYDGYHFTKNSPDIYNPFSLMWAMADGEIGSYWFQSGTPEFLVRQIQKGNSFLPEMFEETVDENILTSSDIFDTQPTALLYQTGYLTIKRFEKPDEYHLGIPNLEVRKGLFENLAKYYFDKGDTVVYNNVRQVRKLLENRNIDEAMERLRTFMAGIPYEFSEKANELHYENNLFIIFMLIGVNARPEWHTSNGRIDLLLSMRNNIYIIELKRDGTPDEALAQIHEKDYARQFTDDPRPIINLGITFSTETRNITAWKAEID